MRTTVNLDERLLADARRRALSRGVTLGQYVEEALRREMTDTSDTHHKPRIPVFTRGTGLRPGIDGSSNRSLYDALDDSESGIRR